ncbi:MAG: 50S ribosomal protein L25 [Bacilli bacterium]
MTFDDGTESRYAMLKDVERHPISEAPLHVDFVEVVRGKPMHAVYRCISLSEAYGVKNENGVIEIHEHEVRVKCHPRDLPEMIVIDISNLKVGEGIHLKDVKAPEGVEFTSDLEDLLVTCNLIKVEEEPAFRQAEGAEADAAKLRLGEADSESALSGKEIAIFCGLIRKERVRGNVL